MTDRFTGLVVTLDADIREDDAQAIISAIHQLRGVVAVDGNVLDYSDHINRQRVRYELRQKLFDALD